jgi:hypothetical protein
LDSSAAILSTEMVGILIGGGKTLGEFPNGIVAGYQDDTAPLQDHDVVPALQRLEIRRVTRRAGMNVLRMTLPPASFANWYLPLCLARRVPD